LQNCPTLFGILQKAKAKLISVYLKHQTYGLTHTHKHMLINVDCTGQIQKNESDIDSRPPLRIKHSKLLPVAGGSCPNSSSRYCTTGNRCWLADDSATLPPHDTTPDCTHVAALCHTNWWTCPEPHLIRTRTFCYLFYARPATKRKKFGAEKKL